MQHPAPTSDWDVKEQIETLVSPEVDEKVVQRKFITTVTNALCHRELHSYPSRGLCSITIRSHQPCVLSGTSAVAALSSQFLDCELRENMWSCDCRCRSLARHCIFAVCCRVALSAVTDGENWVCGVVLLSVGCASQSPRLLYPSSTWPYLIT